MFREIKNNFQFKNLITPLAVMAVFWGIAIWGFVATGYIQPIIMFGYIGTSLGIGLGLYATLPKKQKPVGRRLTLFWWDYFLSASRSLWDRKMSSSKARSSAC